LRDGAVLTQVVEMKQSADIHIKPLRIGREQAPLLVIDQFVAEPDALLEHAQALDFHFTPRAFPGIRALAPTNYQCLLLEALAPHIVTHFGLPAERLRLAMCHYSLVTLQPAELVPLQRVPHVDSLQHNGLATIHYLFRKDLGGTSFYRHRTTGFESIDASREQQYVAAVKREFSGPDAPPPAYINGDTALFERIEAQSAVFNRMLVYKRNSLHSGSIPHDFVPDPNPATGRLSINSFIDAAT
jgi:hypothetical protein